MRSQPPCPGTLHLTCALARREHYLRVGEDGTTKVVHRVAVFDARGCITSVISQLDVMRCGLRRHALSNESVNIISEHQQHHGQDSGARTAALLLKPPCSAMGR